MFDYRRYFERLQYDITAQITLGGILVFMLIFPGYFWIVGSTGSSGDSMNVQGEWEVDIQFTDAANGEDSIFVDDEATEDFEFVIPPLEDSVLYAIVFTLEYDETDEGGPNPVVQDQCDSVTLSLDSSMLSGEISSPDSDYIVEECGTHNAVLVVLLKNFEISCNEFDCSNSSFVTPDNMTLGEIENIVAKNGFGRGPLTVSATVETNTGSTPGPSPGPALSNNEDGEEITISWRAISYTHTIINTADFVDET